MTTDKPTALPVRPMNEDREPIDYPLVAPSSLSADAHHMYFHGTGINGVLHRDTFDDSRRNRFITRDEAEAFRPTERMLAAIAELEAVGLVSYSSEYKRLYINRVHEQYTYVQGRGSQFIKVSIFDKHPDESQLLAVLIGGDLESRDASRGMTELTLRARHDDATDFEHDASSTALLVLRNISEPVFTGYGLITFTGVLTETNLYAIGVDPLKADDGDTRPGDTCTDCQDQHPFAPFLPPRVDSLSGVHFVKVEARPLRPYLVEAPPTAVAAAES